VDNRNDLWRYVDANKERFIALSDRIWEMPELNYEETRSVAEHTAELEHQGFRITKNVANIPTAVMGEAGEGGPVIAFLGEYDALPELSQMAGVAEQCPVEQGGNGHGCGHNLLGSASMLAAVAVKQWLEENKIPGRVRYYGCPAEEGGGAKVFMVRDGAFSDADIAISWHPWCFWQVKPPRALATAGVDFHFKGRSAHSAQQPQLGRSALDAVELMNVGVNYMREHMPSDARVAYAILDAGGTAPNVVQAKASVRYGIRARDTEGARDLVRRVTKIADGAALMTETTVEVHLRNGVSNFIGNSPLERTMHSIMEELGPPHFDEDDRAFAREIRATLSPDALSANWRSIGLAQTDAPLADFTVPSDAPRNPEIASTDVADISWVIPTVQAHAPTYAIGTPFHTWQMVAQGKSGVAHKALVQVAKAMAATGVAALTNPELIAAAKADLAARVGPNGYVSPLRPGATPPLPKFAP